MKYKGAKKTLVSMRYWLCVTNEENWRVAHEKRIWGVPKRRGAIMARVIRAS